MGLCRRLGRTIVELAVFSALNEVAESVENVPKTREYSEDTISCAVQNSEELNSTLRYRSASNRNQRSG